MASVSRLRGELFAAAPRQSDRNSGAETLRDDANCFDGCCAIIDPRLPFRAPLREFRLLIFRPTSNDGQLDVIRFHERTSLARTAYIKHGKNKEPQQPITVVCLALDQRPGSLSGTTDRAQIPIFNRSTSRAKNMNALLCSKPRDKWPEQRPMNISHAENGSDIEYRAVIGGSDGGGGGGSGHITSSSTGSRDFITMLTVSEAVAAAYSSRTILASSARL